MSKDCISDLSKPQPAESGRGNPTLAIMYADKLAGLADAEFVVEAERQIRLSAFANNNPRALAHSKAGAAYDEARRREKPWLYQDAWNRAYQPCGYEPSDEERRRAMPSLDGASTGDA